MSQIEHGETTWAARLAYSKALFDAVKELQGPELEAACAQAREKFIGEVGVRTAERLEATY